MRSACSCGAEWSGLRLEHCTACHLTFTGSTAGDKHRTGRHDTFSGPDRRRCLDKAEMEKIGMRENKHGYWTSGGRDPRFDSDAAQ